MLTALQVLVLLAWGCGFWVLFAVRRCPSRGSAVDAGLLSVVIPARDEEARLPALLESLRRQDRPPLEVIVVDDHSSDRTAEIAERLGARVLPAPPLPPGWTGKTWACQCGALAARGEHLLFLDADTVVEPGGLEMMLRLPVEEPGVHSICPYHRVERPYEGLSAFFNLVMVAGVNAFTALGKRARQQGLFGQSMLVRKEVYLAAGGHEAVKGRILENFFLARKFREKGIATACRVGRGAISMRMFPDGPAGLARGWGKAFASGAAATPPAALVPISIWLTGAATVAVVALLAPLVEGIGPVQVAALYSVFAGQLFWLLRRIGSFSPAAAVLFPVPLAFYFAVFFHSALKARRGWKTRWRGRDVVDGR
jgi:4,4'-diaponeurosporenoate glycosyltransferase